MVGGVRRTLSSSSTSSEPSSPFLTARDSTTALILVNDDPVANSPFDFSSDDEDDAHFELNARPPSKPSTPPLPASIVFVYLVDPFVKLGATLLLHSSLSLAHGLSALLISTMLAAFARQLWYMLARHLRKSDIEDVVLDAFARGRGKERQRTAIRNSMRVATAVMKILLVSLYLKVAVEVLLPIIPAESFWSLRPVVTLLLILCVAPLAFSHSLASKKVIYSTWISVWVYVAWLSCVTYAYTHGVLDVHRKSLVKGVFWQPYSITAFAFCSSSTVVFYTSLRNGLQPITTAKPPKSRSFKILSPVSTIIGCLLVLPLVLYSAFPREHVTLPTPPVEGEEPKAESILPQSIAVLNALILLLAIPSFLVTIPSIPVPDRLRRYVTLTLSRLAALVLSTLLTFVPGRVSRTLNDVLIATVLISTYLIPAILHVTVHFFKKPVTIVMPQTPSTPMPPSSSSRSVPDEGPSQLVKPTHARSRTLGDELLQRKERALQRKQFKKRVVWDIGVWALLMASAAGFAWGVGRLAGQW